MRFDFHSWRMYKECPKRYKLEYVDKAPTPVPENKYHALYGKTVQKFFELYCNIWNKDNPVMTENLIKDKLSYVMESILQVERVDWSARFCSMSKDEIFAKALQDVTVILNSENIKYFKGTTAELPITVTTKDGDTIKSIIDFVHPNNEPRLSDKEKSLQDVVIFDGKGTSKLGKVDNNQLMFYCLVYFFHTRIIPSTTGFFYWKFNTFVPVEVNIDKLNSFRAQLSLDMKAMKADLEFKANPCNKSCQYCGYAPECRENLDRPRRKRNIKSTVPEIEGSGIKEFSF